MMCNPMLVALASLLLGPASFVAQETGPARQKAAHSSGTPHTSTTQAKPPAARPAGQTPVETEAAPRPKPMHETLRSYLRQIKGVRLERADKDPNTIVTHYTSTSGETFDIVVVYSPRKKMVGLYSYAFGNVAEAKDANDLRALLLSANEALAFGSFFVDREQDIGLKWSLRTETPITFEAFQTVYLSLAAAAKEYRPQIADCMKGKAKTPEEADTPPSPPRDDEEDRTNSPASPKVTRERRVRNPQK